MPKLFVTAIKYSTSHYLANLLATTKILNFPMKEARVMCKIKPNEWIEIVPYHELKSKHPLDTILADLEEYEIEIKTTVTNQQ